MPAEFSPDNATFGVISSSSNKPPEVFVMAEPAGRRARQVTTSTSAEWRSQVGRAAARHLQGARRRQTSTRGSSRRRWSARRGIPPSPAVVFVHGAGYLQNAHSYWSSYYREYMFHHLLASTGYVVLDPDYRASAGYGRDWRTAIYRWMGGKDLQDVVDGANYLVEAARRRSRGASASTAAATAASSR